MRQQDLFATNWKHRDSHGGTLRNKKLGRFARPLSTKHPHHLILKSNYKRLRRPANFVRIQELIRKYAKKFYIRVEQVTIQSDHVHLLIRGKRRALFQAFFRVLAGQIAQRLTDTYRKRWTERKLWKYRPFSRVIKGWRAYKIVRDYIQLNEREGRGDVPYRKQRLKGLTPEQIQSLWDQS